MPRRPVIGITLELEDNLILQVEKGIRAPLQEAGAFVHHPAARHAAARAGHGARPDRRRRLLRRCRRRPVVVRPRAVRAKTVAVPPVHDAFEITLARRALELGMPVLGLCRGAQVLAVADGGTLTQDVRDAARGRVAPCVGLVRHRPRATRRARSRDPVRARLAGRRVDRRRPAEGELVPPPVRQHDRLAPASGGLDAGRRDRGDRAPRRRRLRGRACSGTTR